MASLGSLFGSLFGNTQSNAVKDATAATRQGVQQAYDLGKPLIEGGYGQAGGALNKGNVYSDTYLGQGYGAASGALQGAQNTAWGALNNGGTAATNYLNSGYGQARSDLSSLYDSARGAANSAVDKIGGYYQPYMQSGTQAQGLYDTFLGLNGADAAKTAASNFAGNDPGIAYRLDMLGKQSQAQANAAGYLGSNREAVARNRAQNEVLSQDYQTYLSRLADQSAKGGQYAGQLAGYADNAAARTAQLYANQGDRASALAQAQSRDLAQNERQHATSLLDLVQRTGAAQSGLDTNYYGGLASNANNYANMGATNAINQGTTLANLGMGKETALAQTQAQGLLGNAQASSQGLNNLISLGGTIASLATGIPRTGQTVMQQPGTAANGGWSTTAQSQPSSFWNLFS